MRKNALLTFGVSMLLIMSSCQKEHNVPMNPKKIKPETEETDKGKPEKAPDNNTDDNKNDDSIPPVKKDEKEPDPTPTPPLENKPEVNSENKKIGRPSDHDIATRLTVGWKAGLDIEKNITLDVDALFGHSREAKFSAEELSQFVVFQATAVGSSKVYTLTEDDLKKLTLSNFGYESGLMKFVARYGKQGDTRELFLSLSREKYYMNRIITKDVSHLFMHGVHLNIRDQFTSDLFEYDHDKYEVHIISSTSSRNALNINLSVEAKDRDDKLSTLSYEVKGFRPLSDLKLIVSPQSEASKKISDYYSKFPDTFNKTVKLWIKKLNFTLNRNGEDIPLTWDTDRETRQDVLKAESPIKKYADIYFISPQFSVEEVNKLPDEKLMIKIKLNQIGESEVENTNLELIVTIPSK